jgi:hypothetical protein
MQQVSFMFCESHLEAAVLLCGIANLPVSGAVGNSNTDSPVCFNAVNVLKEFKIKVTAMFVKLQERIFPGAFLTSKQFFYVVSGTFSTRLESTLKLV